MQKEDRIVWWSWIALFAFLLIATLLTFPAKAQLFLGNSTPVLGQIQDGEMSFCIERKDAESQMAAVIGGSGHKSWDKKVAQGKCGITHVPFLYFKILGTGWDNHHKLYLVELRLKLKHWAPAYAFTTFRPLGLQLIHDTPHFVQAPADWQKWFSEARTTEESRPRLAAQGFTWHSCCNKADRVKTQFRVNRQSGADEWWYLDPTTQRWIKLENDIIHYEDDPTMPTQLKTEGVLFVYNGLVTCFWAPQEGG